MLKDSLHSLALVLQRTANNPNTTPKNRELAKEALDAVRQSAWDLDDPRMEEETTTRLQRITSAWGELKPNEEEVQNT